MASTSTVGVSRSSEDNYLSDTGSNQKLVPQSPPGDYYPDSYDSATSSQRHLSPTSPYDAPAVAPRAYNGPATRRVPSPQPYPGVSVSDPFRPMTTSPTGYDESASGYSVHESDEGGGARGGASRSGVRLMDSGPVPGPEGVRRVSRAAGGRRPTSQTPQQNRYSRNSAAFSLPPGAAPPQPYSGGTAQ